MEKFEATFSYEKSTTNTHRYQEDAEGSPVKIGSLYVQKSALSGTPKKLRVTVEVVE